MPLSGMAVIALAVLLAACGGNDAGPSSSPTPSGVRVVTPRQAWDTIQTQGNAVVILDVRTPQEFAEGHIPGARNIDAEASDFSARVGALDRGKIYVVYCRTARRSAIARGIMVKLGFTQIQDVAGGMLAWKAARLPTTTS
jgi:rhodanese-related sulfurtransferase